LLDGVRAVAVRLTHPRPISYPVRPEGHRTSAGNPCSKRHQDADLAALPYPRNPADMSAVNDVSKAWSPPCRRATCQRCSRLNGPLWHTMA
jgi:hypothetical protein